MAITLGTTTPFSNTATTREVVQGLLAIGISAPELAGATGVSVSAVRNWASGQAQPRNDASITLEDLRTVAMVLLESDMEPERVAAWLTRRLPDTLARPIDEIASDPTAVIDAAIAESGKLVTV